MSVRLGEYRLTLPQSACFQPGWNVQSCDLSKELVVADGPGVVDRLGHLFLLTVQWVYRSAPTVLLAPAPPAEVLDQSLVQPHFFARRHAQRLLAVQFLDRSQIHRPG